MAYPTEVNSQITDAVTQANVEVLGSAPAQAMGAMYGSFSHSLGLAFQNAVSAQQNANTIMQAVTAQAVNLLLQSDSQTQAVVAPSHE